MLIGMEFTELSPDDTRGVRACVEVTNAVRRADSPWMPPLLEHEVAGMLRHGWDLEPDLALLGTVGDEVVATASISMSSYDNLDLAWLDLTVHPGHRRRGHGSALLAEVEERVRAAGRSSLGASSWDAEAPRGFARRHGFEQKAVQVNRWQFLAELDRAELDRLYAEASAHATAYELVRRDGPSPDAELEDVAAMAGSINDAPTDDLDIEDELYSAERVRAYETAMQRRDIHLYRVLARHRETGDLAGHSVVGVYAERPEHGEQHDTTVVAAHRGHRLGLVLKLDMLRWLREAEPQLATVETWNAESNDFMIGVNEAMGYRVLGRVLDFQRPV